MVHRSMENGSRGGRRIVYKRVSMVLEDFLFFSLYSFSCITSNSTTLERYSDSCSSIRTSSSVLQTFISPAPDPARYTRTSLPYTHLIADVLSTLPDSLL